MTVYTLGLWRVRPGREDDFARIWSTLAEETRADFPGAVGTLLRDRDDPHLFISFGPWESVEQVHAFRESEAFGKGLAAMSGLLDGFDPHTLDLAAQVGAG